MIHQPSGGAQGQATDIAIQAEQILRVKRKMNQILSDNDRPAPGEDSRRMWSGTTT